MSLNLTKKKAALENIEALLEHRKLLKARSNFKDFCEYVIKDEEANAKIKLAEVQLSWINHIAFCKQNKLHALILAPMGHGKTQIVSVALPLYLLGKNLNARIKLVCLSDDSAKERLGSIRAYINDDTDYQKVFPKVQRDKGAEWSKHNLSICRDTYAKDPSLSVKGITAGGIGGRADFLLVDDIFDYRAAVTQPATREQYVSTYNLVWLTRLVPGGLAVVICTRWHERDLAGEILSNPQMKNQYGILIQAIKEDFTGIEVRAIVPDHLKEEYIARNPGFQVIG